ncbi:hypothetical protein GCM10022214_14640 [Actinomadura miaoliensis]|uniref:Uncharacterized protein n=1 Tax=Actinomadura miaoliensis TaxID=430685 RepID=A0ABP7V9X7_9ACTN
MVTKQYTGSPPEADLRRADSPLSGTRPCVAAAALRDRATARLRSSLGYAAPAAVGSAGGRVFVMGWGFCSEVVSW